MNARSVMRWRRHHRARYGWGRALAGRLAVCGLAMTAVVWPDPASATTPATSQSTAMTPAAMRFPAGSRVEPLADRLWLYGLPLQAVVFDAPVDVPELIRTLSRQQPALRDLMVLPGVAILSGRLGDALWMAVLASPVAGRSVGSVSSLLVSTTRQDAPLPAWLPPAARLELDVVVADGGVRMSERIWQHPLSPARLASVIRQGLRRHGWEDDGKRADAGDWQSWRRHGERLDWLLLPLDAGSGLWIRRRVP
jgi:hypothetical protein